MGQHSQILSPVLGRSVGVFAVEQQYVGDVASRLHHLAAAGEIVRPDLGVGGPGLVAMEPLAVFEQPQTGEVIIRGLRRRIVYDETVQAACEGGVGDHLDITGIIRVGALTFSVHGERLGGADVLPVDMCHGCTLAYVGNGRGQHGT